MAVDTSVLLLMWSDDAAGAQSDIDAARRLVDVDVPLLIPAAALGETLGALSEARRVDIVQRLQQLELLLPYDGNCALLTGMLGRPRALGATTRQQVKWDFAIAATCAANDVDVLLALDSDFEELFSRLGVGVAVISPTELA